MSERLAFVRPEALQLEPVVHGSLAAAELGLAPRDVLDFSVNTNPLGPGPSVLQAAHSPDWSRYPGNDEAPLRCRLAERADVAAEQVVPGNGSAEFMWLIVLAALRTGDPVAIVGPTFGEYARAVRVVGATPIEVDDPQQASSTRALFLCNPNNPTGHYRGQAEIEYLLDEQPRRLVVLDEAYPTFVDQLATTWWRCSQVPSSLQSRSSGRWSATGTRAAAGATRSHSAAHRRWRLRSRAADEAWDDRQSSVAATADPDRRTQGRSDRSVDSPRGTYRLNRPTSRFSDRFLQWLTGAHRVRPPRQRGRRGV
jgi:histidinol-phosphate/aromatic aminotransferase/cobyric acid decarboxylase-like protein